MTKLEELEAKYKLRNLDDLLLALQQHFTEDPLTDNDYLNIELTFCEDFVGINLSHDIIEDWTGFIAWKLGKSLREQDESDLYNIRLTLTNIGER